MGLQADKPSFWHRHFHNFDIDKYLNHIVPRSRIYLLPRPISHFLGYRPPSSSSPQPAQPLIWLSALLGGFIGVAIITAVYHALPLLDGHQVPVVIASFGAAAVLEYNTIESPLSQPRNLIVGHFLSAAVGVAITKCFETLPAERFEELRWLSGAISVGVASALMGITKTIHPPAGATALLASTSADITVLGWWFLPLILLGSTLMASSALVVNNILRRWPLYWWTPADLSKLRPKNDVVHVKDVERNAEIRSVNSTKDTLVNGKSNHIEYAGARSDSEASSDNQQADLQHQTEMNRTSEHEIKIQRDQIIIPDWMEFNNFEENLLRVIQQKLQQRQ